MLEYTTQIIKLQNGEDLIANVALSGTNYVLEEPMSFYLDQRNNNTLVMAYWLPVQLVKNNCAEVKITDVLSVIEPDSEFIEYYVHTIHKFKLLLKARKDMDSMDLNGEIMEELINEFKDMEHDGDTLH
jgi:hypothetical protein